jgi:hypothetical protein
VANNSPIERLKKYLNSLRDLVEKLDIEKVVYKEGTKAGQIAYHAAQSANFWIKVKILKGEYPRDREAEFVEEHSLEEILSSIESAIKSCEEFEKRNPSLDQKLHKEDIVTSYGFIIDSVGTALIHVTSHTAEHYGELSGQK